MIGFGAFGGKVDIAPNPGHVLRYKKSNTV